MVDAFKIGAMGTDVLTGRVTRIMTTAAVTADAGLIGGTFKFAGADYVVPGGKTLRITGFTKTQALASGAGIYVDIRYADNAALTVNPVSIITLPSFASTANIADFVYPCAGVVGVPAGKYIGTWNPSAGNHPTFSTLIIGYEE